jgi:ACT domain-containing protein
MAKPTTADAARQLGISRTALYKLIDQIARPVQGPSILPILYKANRLPKAL